MIGLGLSLSLGGNNGSTGNQPPVGTQFIMGTAPDGSQQFIVGTKADGTDQRIAGVSA